MFERLVVDGWREVPDLVARLYKEAGEGAPLKPAADLFAALQSPAGGPHPLAATIVGGLAGAGLGYAGGAAAEQFLPEDQFERGRLRRSLAIAGAGLGAAPGLAWAGVNASSPEAGGGGLAGVVSGWPFNTRAAAAIPEAFRKAAGMSGAEAVPSVPVDAFNRAIWSDVMVTPERYGTRDFRGDNSQPLSTPPWAAAAASGIVAGAAAYTGRRAVSPLEVGVAAAATAGTGYLAGMAFGRAMGALAGLHPAAQDRLRTLGLWGGLVTGAVRSLYGE